MDVTDTSLFESRSDSKTPHQPKDVSTTWGSAESGYFTTPTPGGSVEINSGSFGKRKNDSFLHLPGETPKNTGIRLGKRGSFTDAINNHYENDSLLSNSEPAISCENIKVSLTYQSNDLNQENVALPHTITNYNEDNSPVFAINDFANKIEESQICIIRNESKSCPVTPIKNKVLLKHSSFSPKSNYSDAYEPKTPVYFFSPIIIEQNENSNSVQRSSNKKSCVKRPNLSAISEKNSILYNDRPTTPPKHRTPVKSHIKRLLSTSAKTKLDFDCREKLDILGKLGQRDLGYKILELLYREDLCRVCLVSKRWRDICLKDSLANKRRKMYLEERRFDKENIINNTKKISEKDVSSSRKEFLEIQNKSAIPSSSQSISQQPLSPPVSPKRANHLKFVKAGKKLEPRRCLRKCPKCAGPARPTHLLNVDTNSSSTSKNNSSQSHIENEIRAKRTHRELDSKHRTLEFDNMSSISINPFNSTPKTKRRASGMSLPFYNNQNETLCSSIEYSYASTSVNNSLNNNSDIFNNSIMTIATPNLTGEQLSHHSYSNYGVLDNKETVDTKSTPLGIFRLNKTDMSDVSVASNLSDIYHCSSDKCGYVFCELCTGPAHPDGACPPTQTGLQSPSPTRNDSQPNLLRIGGKKSRKNLRRLLE